MTDDERRFGILEVGSLENDDTETSEQTLSVDEPLISNAHDLANQQPDTAAAEFQRSETAEMERLVCEWSEGAGWEENIGHGQSFVERFGDEASRELLDGYGLGDHASIIRIASRAGRHIADLERELAELKGEASEAPLSDGAPAQMSDARRGTLEEEHRRLRRDPDYWTSVPARRRVREIMEALHGTRPVHTPLAAGRARSR